jgi:hypothetical protein
VNGVREPGVYTLDWHAGGAPSGIYFYRLTALPARGGTSAPFTDQKKMLLVK